VVDEVYDEKRGFVRMTVDTLVTFNLKGKGDTAYHGTSQNLSATGLSMTTETGMTIGDDVELIMNSSDNKFPPFVAEGTVVRSIADETNADLYLVSISLTKTH